MKDYTPTIISQYANSPTMLAVIEAVNQFIDPAVNLEAFYNLVWNLDTAKGYGLDVWGRIVGVLRVLSVPLSPVTFGFYTGGPDWQPFGQAPFRTSSNAQTANFELDDTSYRLLILVKAAANIAATNAQNINQLMQSLFGSRGRCYCIDHGNMQMRYIFEFYLTPLEFSILNQAGLLPKPTGVALTLLQIPANSTFGFAEAGPLSQPFGQGPFLSEYQVIPLTNEG